MRKALAAIAASISLCCGPLLAQQAQTGAPQDNTIKAGSEEVVVDAVVRDKKGRAVTDLTADDFTVLDNGNQKKIKTFRLVQGTEGVTAGTRTQLDPLRQIRLVSLIFDNLDLNSRRLAREAALDLIKSDLPQNVYMAIMTIDHKLQALQPFTNDRELLRKAIERATSSGTTDFSADTAGVVTQLEQMVGPANGGTGTLEERVQQAGSSANAAPTAQAAPNGSNIANAAMARMLLDTLKTERDMAATQAGRAEVFGLLDAVKDQYQLPGRKTILYFSTGLITPQGTERALEDITSLANRNNVSIYCIDARGLNIASTNKESMDALNSAMAASRDQQTNPNAGVSHNQAKIMDTSVDSMAMNLQNNLATLAESTGGTLIANTNDFRGPLRKVAEDIETYYEISYNPEIQNYDGSLHKITLKTSERDLRIQARSGYFALPPSLVNKGAVISAWEVPLLKVLDTPQPPHTFDFHATGLHFRGTGEESVCDLVIDIPLANLTLEEDKAKGEFAGHFSYVTLVKNAEGEIVKKFQNDIPLNVPSPKMAALKESHFIYTEHFALPPGRYRLETAMLDRQGNKISARKTSIFMPAASHSIAISSVSAVRSLKATDATNSPTDPLVIANRIVTPTLAPQVSKTTNPNGLPFYVVIYPDKTNTAKPQLIMEFSKDGQVLGSGTPDIGTPDDQGRIQYVADAPIAKLDPGSYQVRFIAKQGEEAAQESVSFTVQQ